MPLDRRAQRLLDMLAGARTAPTAPTSALARREALIALAQMADEAETPARIEHASFAGPGGPIDVRIYAPPESPPGAVGTRPGLVFFHGGGWVAGGFATHDGFCRRVCAAADCRVIAVDYRLAPEHRFPSALDDCMAAVEWAARSAAALGLDPARLAVGGDSAGGGLAAAVAQTALAGNGPMIALQVLICPILDVGRTEGTRETFGDGFFIDRAAFARDLADYLPPDASAADPRLSPLRAASFAGLPPALVHVAEFDPFRDEGEAYAEALRGAGAPAEVTRHGGMIHYFYALARMIPQAHDAAAAIGAQIRRAFGEG